MQAGLVSTTLALVDVLRFGYGLIPGAPLRLDALYAGQRHVPSHCLRELSPENARHSTCKSHPARGTYCGSGRCCTTVAIPSWGAP